MTFSYSPAYADDTIGLYIGWITSNDWDVGTVTVTLTITLSNPRILAPAPYIFDIEILAHSTIVTVTGATTKPYGNQTDLSVILTDLETGGIVPIGSVTNIRLQHPFGFYDSSGSYDITLDTSSWTVGTHTVTVVVTISGTIYTAPTNYQFTITIRSMTSVIYHGPSTLNFTIGSDFTVNLHLNISEEGPYYGDPITGRLAGEFSVPIYVISLDTSQQAIGLYRLTIDESNFAGGNYQITVYFTSTDNRYGNTILVIQFTYREIISYLSSPNYPQVTTPYGQDVQIILEYADADSLTGIEGAKITSPDHQNWTYNPLDLTGGVYSIWINVTGLSKGTHNISLTADLSGFTARTLLIRIVVRDAYTSATPSVGSLDIPIGNSPFFYVDYIDIDRILPIDNLTAPYSIVTSDWGGIFSVEYIPGMQQYMFTIYTTDSSPMDLNQPYNFTFTKDNYKTVKFAMSITIRTHNTEFRLVSSIEPTSTIGTFNISVYYGDLDNAVGINSPFVDFRVSNGTDVTISNVVNLNNGFYIIQVPASQFGLGLQVFTVYADWTGPIAKYQNKSFVTSANVVGRDSALTLLLGSEPTPYNEDMSYTFFYSDLFSGVGIDNLTNNVFIYVSFQGESVSSSDIVITDFSGIENGTYSIEFNTGIFSRTGLIYMNVFVNWSKGVSPFYSNRTDTISVRVLPRDTLLSITQASSTSYNENATFTLRFEDITGDSLITDDPKLTISLNVSFSYVENAGIFTITVDTSQFGSLGIKAIRIDMTWIGSPFYANRTGRITYVNVVARVTSLEYLTPPPTQYGDQVVFNVTWTDTTEGASIPITSATLVLKEGSSPIDTSEYIYVEIAPGIYQVTLNTTYAMGPGTDELRVDISAGVFYYDPNSINRQFSILERATIVATNPVADVPFGSSIIIVVSYLDLFTGASIANDAAHGYPVTIEVLPSGQTFTSSWRAVFQNYELNISWNPSWDATWTPGTIHSFTIRMSYAYQAPFYAENQAYITFEIRIRESSLELDTEPETTPYLDNVTFTVFYSDDDAGGIGITSADLSILGFSETTDYVISEGGSGYYTITVFTTSLVSLGTHVLDIQADWVGAPYHDVAIRRVSVFVRTRATNLEVTVPPSQTLYLDYVTFEFEFNDLDAGTSISLVDLSIIHLYWPNMTEINQLDYSIILNSGTYEITISSIVLSTMPVTGLSIRVVVDWSVAQAPFYADDFTIVKVTITGRSILVETEQIERTPKGDILNITVNLSDLDNGNPIEDATIQFSCQSHFLIEGIDYTRTEGLGTYTFNIDTLSLTGTGTFLFDIRVQWNPNLSPFYSNRSLVTLTGLVDLVRTSLQVNAIFPSSVQYTGDVSIRITWSDLDHGLPVTGFAAIIESNIEYLISGLPPADLIVFEIGTTGVYNISFSTSDLLTLRSYTLVIIATGGKYAQAIATPQFSVVAINTELEPLVTSLQLNWTDHAFIYVDFRSLLHDSLISGASVSWSIAGVFGDYLTPTATPGRYMADIYTADVSIGSGSKIITITASLDKYTTATTQVTLVILALPSDIIFVNPSGGVLDVSRGNSIPIAVVLNDTERATLISNLQVETIYVTFQGIQYPLNYMGLTSTWNVTIPGSATVLLPGSYDVRITAGFYDYQSAGNQFRINIKQTETTLKVLDPETGDLLEYMDSVYSEIVYFTLNLTENVLNTTINNASVDWFSSDFNNLRLYFTFNSSLGLWVLEFNTSLGFYGTWGLTFRANPNDPILAPSTTTLTLTIKKITTEVIGPAVTEEVDWGWVGYISFFYNDTAFNRGISNATVTYSYGLFTGLEAIDLENGTYLLFINTTYLTSDARHRISVDFEKVNFEERTGGANIFVNVRDTELIVSVDDSRTSESSGDPTDLQIPMGDLMNITFFYSDISPIGGLAGGLSFARIQATLSATPGTYLYDPRNVTLDIILLANGHYSFIFDTNDLTMYESTNSTKIILNGQFFLSIHLEYLNRQSQDVTVYIRIITTESQLERDQVIVSPLYYEYNLTNDNSLVIDIYYHDTWHDRGIEGASFIISYGATAIITSNSSLGDGYYRLVITAVAYGGDSVIHITLLKEFHDPVDIEFLIHTFPNDFDTLVLNITSIGLPLSFGIILLLGAYVKVWSVPKRIRQINGQLKTLRKGKVPKPIKDVKTRQQLAAELFNDTYEKLKITRTAAQMPEDAIPIEVPEMGELLMQLAILTNLSSEELDDFQADIAKMKISEQAAFVKEVIMQEAIRAARRDGKTIEEVIAVVEKDALRRLGGEEVVEPIAVVDTGPEETVFLEEKKKVTKTPDEEVTPVKKDEFEEVTETTSEKMSMYELDELRRDLERRGIPPHEIDTIIEQAKELSRDLVDELVKSLEGTKD
ncbi:MAG: hypothetical protein KGD60_09925 [Candidatus Thorarchaeota archaeon]|nr:hypothetical protein [Candidatus Thorarchaeota archaeon]